MKLSQHSFLLVGAFLATQLLATPKIEFDTKTFQCGTVIEGKTDVIKAVFHVKNTGDALLKLENVRPGCGCTIVKYDTLIQPGKSAKIESSVRIIGYHGAISKSIMVSSNAQNEPSVQLTIKAVIQFIIDISENYLNFEGFNANHPKTLYLSTKKTDLKIAGMEFQFSEKNSGQTDWQSSIPLTIQYKAVPKDSTRYDGYKVFGFELIAPVFDKPENGQIIIKTNHPDKPEIIIPTTIGK
jgi:hypothetical protein